MLQYTMIIGIAIEIPFALGEMILGLEVNLYKYKLGQDFMGPLQVWPMVCGEKW